MNQRPLRLFVSYAGNEILNEPLFQRLIEDLRAQYVEMILDDGHSHSETEMQTSYLQTDSDAALFWHLKGSTARTCSRGTRNALDVPKDAAP